MAAKVGEAGLVDVAMTILKERACGEEHSRQDMAEDIA